MAASQASSWAVFFFRSLRLLLKLNVGAILKLTDDLDGFLGAETNSDKYFPALDLPITLNLAAFAFIKSSLVQTCCFKSAPAVTYHGPERNSSLAVT